MTNPKIKLTLVDDFDTIVLKICKSTLVAHVKFFEKLFKYHSQKQLTIFVKNVLVAQSILSYYVVKHYKIPDKMPQWKYVLESLLCMDYFCINVDISLLNHLCVPTEGFDLLLETIGALNLCGNRKIMKNVKKNMPNNYDVSKLSNELINILISCNNNKIMMIFESRDSAEICGINYQECFSVVFKKLHNDILIDNENVVFCLKNKCIYLNNYQKKEKLKKLIKQFSIITIYSYVRDKIVFLNDKNNFGKIIVFDLDIDASLFEFELEEICVNAYLSAKDEFIIIQTTKKINIYDLKTGKLHFNLAIMKKCHLDVKNDLILIGNRYKIKIINLKNRIIHKLKLAKDSDIDHLIFSTNGQRFIAALSTNRILGMIKVWNINDLSLVKEFCAHKNTITTLLLTSNDNLISIDNYSIKMWDSNHFCVIEKIYLTYYKKPIFLLIEPEDEKDILLIKYKNQNN